MQARKSVSRLLRVPDLRALRHPPVRSSARIAESGVVEEDRLQVHRVWLDMDPHSAGDLKYVMYHFTQQEHPDVAPYDAYKAIRFLRITRVPRYLRELASTSNNGDTFALHRKMLASLRERGVLFIQLIGKGPNLPMIYAYGVQAVAPYPEQAQEEADRSFAVLENLIAGLYQQMEYVPLTIDQMVEIQRYQSQWRHIAVARGRPRPSGDDAAVNSWLDGNRTDVAGTLNMLESFLRGMSDRSFLLTTITIPIPPAHMALALRNLTKKLSEIRSEQSGMRAVNAGLALPIGMAYGTGHDHGSSHIAGETIGQGASDGVSRTDTVGVTDGVSLAKNVADSVSVTDGVSHSIGHSVSDSVGHTLTDGVAHGVSHQIGVNRQDTLSDVFTQSVTDTVGHSTSHGMSAGLSHGIESGRSEALTHGETSSQSRSVEHSRGSSSSVGVTRTDGGSFSTSYGQTQNLLSWDHLSTGASDTLTRTTTRGENAGFGYGLSSPLDRNFSDSHSEGLSRAHANSLTEGWLHRGSQNLTLQNASSWSDARSLTGTESQSVSVGDTVGRSLSNSSTRSVSSAESLAASWSESVAQSASMARAVGASHAAGASTGFGSSVGVGETMSTSASAATSRGTAVTGSTGESVSQALAQGRTVGHTEGVSQAQSVARADGTMQSLLANQAYNQAYVNSMSRSAQQSGNLGVIPSVGVTIARNTENAAKRILGDILEEQSRRYLEGVELGAFSYQMFLLCEDRETLAGAAGLLKASFIGPGTNDHRLVQPFHVIGPDRLDEETQRSLREHASAFTSLRRREPELDPVRIEPYVFSTFITPTEAASMFYPPAAEAPGMLVVHDSMPVFAMPTDRQDRDVRLGWIVNGERAKLTSIPWSVGLEELTHVLVAGTTGSGKTTTLLRFGVEASRVRRTVTRRGPNGEVTEQEVRAGLLVLDWTRNFRKLAKTVDEDRFRLFSVLNPEQGPFRWNPLALPHDGVDPNEWIATLADVFAASYGLMEMGRSLFVDLVTRLFKMNRLTSHVLRDRVVASDGSVVSEPVVLPALEREQFDDSMVRIDPYTGEAHVDVFSCPASSRTIGLNHLAALIQSEMDRLSTREAAAQEGLAIRDRFQSLWRRVMAFRNDGPLAWVTEPDRTPTSHETIRIPDLIDPEKGLVAVVEAEGLDLSNRKFLLGSLLAAIWRYGTHHGDGVYSGGNGPGTFVILEEAHELFGSASGGGGDPSSEIRVQLYEALFRRARSLGLRLIAAVQNPAHTPDAIVSNVGLIIAHTLVSEEDKRKMAGLMNWQVALGQHYRETRFLGELPIGHCIVRLRARKHFLEAAPVLVAVDAPEL